jgi:hypothetical protein
MEGRERARETHRVLVWLLRLVPRNAPPVLSAPGLRQIVNALISPISTYMSASRQ